MSAFDPAGDLTDDLAFELLSFSPITVFWRTDLFEDAVASLESDGYQIVRFESSIWSSTTIHDDFAQALAFPDYYGRNLDALDDCLYDVVNLEYGWKSNSTGLVITFSGYDGFVRYDRRTANVILDIFAMHSRRASLVGRRLLCLVQTDDPALALDPVGASNPTWNRLEWLDANRK